MASSLLVWLIWVTPLVGALLTPIFAKIHSRVRDVTAVGFTFVAAVLATVSSLTVSSGDYTVAWIPSLNINAGILVDPLSMFMANIVAWISLLIMIYSVGYMKGEFGLTRYWFFMNLFIGNMLLLVLSDNLLMMFFGWEGVGLCSYALIGHFYRDEPQFWVGSPGDKALGVSEEYSATKAGMKAFIMTRIGDIALLIAIFLIYAFARTFNYNQLVLQLGGSASWAANLARLGLLLPAALLFFGGPIGKSAQFPLQEWLPDAMTGPASVSALIHAATMVKAGVFLTGRMGPVFFIALSQFNQVPQFFGVIAWVGAFTALLAASQAAVAREIKKVLAYSTISQIGYMMLALGVAGLSANFLAGYSAGLFHLLSHAVFKASLFLAAGWVLHVAGSRFMDEMGGLAKAMRLTSASMLLAGLSLMGIPPFSGFWTKDAILSVSFLGGQYILYGLALATAFITGFYTVRMLGITLAGKPSRHVMELTEGGKHPHEAGFTMLIPYLLLAVGSLALGLAYPFYSGPLVAYLANTFSSAAYKLPAATSPTSGITDLLLFSVSTMVAVIGGVVGYLLYFKKLYEFKTDMNPIQRFLYNRWYLDAIYYKVFVSGLLAASRGLYELVEQGIWNRLNNTIGRDIMDYSRASDQLDTQVVDRAANEVASYGSRLSNLLRRLQTGVTEQYIIGFAIGIILLLAYMLFVVGAT
ncbi:MAG TPA: NADH-quinone oxidoreductase subunit L [Candidatus Bathyarchaeia archaeon]|nr:NADH-quinone oxidoreductase subunit L [Candidatus Bathyarchaeia archaeon]